MRIIFISMNCQPTLEIAFGLVLRTLRKEKSFSQEGVANVCDWDRTFISLLERGKLQPSQKTIFILSEALEVAPLELIKMVEEQCRSE